MIRKGTSWNQIGKEGMKKICAIVLLAGLALQQALSQTNVPETSQGAPSVADTNAPPAATVGADQAVEPATGAETAGVPAVTGEESSGMTNSPAAATKVYPEILLKECPITAAIEQLARQAGINYILDPKIGYGQPDANGVIKPEPLLTIRWENITAEQALMAILDTYSLQLVQNRESGIARITTKEPNAPPPLITRVFQLKYAGVSNMVEDVQSTLTDKRSKVLPVTRTSQLVVVATEPEQEAVESLISQLDEPTRQVLIQARLVEISSNPSTTKGVNWENTLSAQNIAFGNGILSPSSATTITAPGVATGSSTPGGGYPPPTPSSSASSLLTLLEGTGGFTASTASGLIPSTGFLTADGVKAVISFLNESSDAQVLSTPSVVTLDNEPATIAVTRAFPVINVTAGTQNTAGGSSISYSNIGTILTVTPRISANDYIQLKVVPDVSSFFATVSKTIDGELYQADEFDSRHIETQVLIPNANTLVMGGMVKDNPNSTYTKVPILGDIPVLGWAFRSENKTLDKDNLLIFITPTIVKDTDFQPSQTDFLQSRPRIMQSPMNPHTRWDGAEPTTDWANPAPEPNEFDKPVVSPANQNY